MESGCDVVLVDVNGAQTNGINGANGTNGAHAEEAPDMKTRSKVAVGAVSEAGGDDEFARLKVRLTRTTVAPPKSADNKEPLEAERAAKKQAVRSGAPDVEETSAAKGVSKEPAATDNSGAAKAASCAVGATGAAASAAPKAASCAAGAKEVTVTAIAKAPSCAVGAKEAAASAAAKKRADEDSGVNSRASSVSTDEAGTAARMRPRRSQARVPIAIYEFDAASFDDDLPAGPSTSKAVGGGVVAQKRKSVFVEEMDEEPGSAEPAAKRPAFLVSAGAGIVTSLLYPLRKLRSGIEAVRPFKAQSSATSVEVGEEEEGADDAVAESATGSETAAQSGEPPAAEARSNCSLM